MTDEPKPCPFCGGEAKVAKEGSWTDQSLFYSVFCTCCRSQGYWFRTIEEAIAAWNQRAERTCHIVQHGHLFTLSDGTELYESACSECGAYLGDEDNYCSICGARVVD